MNVRSIWQGFCVGLPIFATLSLVSMCTYTVSSDPYVCDEAKKYIARVDRCIDNKYCNITLKEMERYETSDRRVQASCK
jgi:hypothetical protein